MEQQYKVGPKGSVVVGDKNRVIIKPGERLPLALVTPQQIEALLKARVIFPEGGAVVVPVGEKLPSIGVSDNDFDNKGKSSDVPTPAGGSTAEAAKAVETIRLKRIADAEAEALAKLAAQKNETRQQAPVASGPWTFDPDKLVGKPIEELRQMVLSIDKDMEVNHLDEVEVIALLSADFQAVTG